MTKPPEKFAKLYDVDFDGVCKEVEFIEEGFAPGATSPTWLVRRWEGGGYHKSRVAPDYYCRSKSEAYTRYIKELKSGCKALTKQIKEQENQLKVATGKLALAQALLDQIKKEEN